MHLFISSCNFFCTQLALDARIKLPFKPYVAKLPLVFHDLDEVIREVDVAFVLPSTILHELFKQGPEVCKRCLFNDGPECVFEWWKREDKTFADSLGGLEALKHTLPLLFHEDALPKWSWSTPFTSEGSWITRKCVVGLTTRSMSKATRHGILDVLAWDLRACAEGVFPVADHTGKAFAPDSPEGQRAGQPIAEVAGVMWKAHFAYWKGDQEAAASARDSHPCFMQCFLVGVYISVTPAPHASCWTSACQGSHKIIQACFHLCLVLCQQNVRVAQLRKLFTRCILENDLVQNNRSWI